MQLGGGLGGATGLGVGETGTGKAVGRRVVGTREGAAKGSGEGWEGFGGMMLGLVVGYWTANVGWV